MLQHHLKFRSFKLFYQDLDAAESMIRQIEEFPSFFTPVGDSPLIVDCGANIGVSMLEWKTRWPQSQVLCFEPDPFAFAALEQNVDVNDIPGVRCINAALSDTDGKTTLYGDICAGGDARGNSIEPVWGNRSVDGVRGSGKQTTVNCTRLSTHLASKKIAFLKLDIEGVEQSVLTEINDLLGNIDAIYAEVHETNETIETNSAVAIESQLRAAGFQVESESRFDEHALPAHLDAWRREVGARQVQLLAWR
ncbi:31-O-demethyl-FK506 methyltransferase FkbM [Planctomycetes bacterium CA13]|uniref:31-O-demethyl-FK506 methyltransferase FkbM n=1 Tax=Novipirellula herctigrandis TaxID=2527986 RepID=A0A5C5YY77_9BACT|nr:31-O-demethyl-FK506 methyltransferase FkbM [Planctomycetes bacterium CA13]